MCVCLWTWSCQFLTAAVLAEQPGPQLRCTVSYMRVSLVAFRPMHVQMDRVLFCKLHCPKQQMFDAVAPVLRSIIGIVISELWTPLEGEIASLFG